MTHPQEVEAATRFAEASNAFGFDLYRELRERGGDLAMSPASLSIALAMTWPCARGETAAEMQRVHFIRDNQTGLVLFMGRVADPTTK